MHDTFRVRSTSTERGHFCSVSVAILIFVKTSCILIVLKLPLITVREGEREDESVGFVVEKLLLEVMLSFVRATDTSPSASTTNCLYEAD